MECMRRTSWRRPGAGRRRSYDTSLVSWYVFVIGAWVDNGVHSELWVRNWVIFWIQACETDLVTVPSTPPLTECFGLS